MTAMPALGIAPLLRELRTPSADRHSRRRFLERVARRPTDLREQGLAFIGIGGACGKPAFMLPYPLVWNEASTLALEALAARWHCRVEYGALAHLKRRRDDRELAALQDGPGFGIVYVRAEEALASALLRELIETFDPKSADGERAARTPAEEHPRG